MNIYAIKAIYIYEMSRFFRTIIGSLISPIISTTLYFIVFGSAIGSRITDIDGITYGAFIVPGLMMLNMMTSSLNNGAFGIYFPKFSGTIYEILSAPVSSFEIVIGYVGAAATKSILIGFLIVPKPLSFNPKGSLKLTPSIVKSLNLVFAPITLISASLPTPPFTETLGSILAKSATDLFIVGTASISALVIRVLVPILNAEAGLAVTITSSAIVLLVKVTPKLNGSPRDR